MICWDTINEHGFVFGPSEASAQLLQEDSGALGGPEHLDGVDFGQVNAFIEDVHGEYAVQLPILQLAQ